jgi:hypothetical protein
MGCFNFTVPVIQPVASSTVDTFWDGKLRGEG